MGTPQAPSPVQNYTESGFERFLLNCANVQPDKLVGMFQSFFDEAGGADHGFITVCGWVASVDRWQRFESEWKEMLARFDVPYFHLKELSQCRGPFSKWWGQKNGEREEFFEESARIVRETVEPGFLCVAR
jgi:hypothetical protein